MTNDSKLFKTSSATGGLPLYEGKMIWQFSHEWAEPRFWVEEHEGRRALLGRNPDTGQKLPYQDYRLAIRAVASNTNERSMICAIIPPNVFSGNSALTSVGGFPQRAEMLFCMAILDSFAIDAMLRNKVTTNINMFFIYQLPVPRYSIGDPVLDAIVERAARLVCTTPEFDALAREVGLRSHQDGVTNAIGRARLRAELDGLVAHLYGLTEEEFAHILTTGFGG
jgi:hypothetical protein